MDNSNLCQSFLPSQDLSENLGCIFDFGCSWTKESDQVAQITRQYDTDFTDCELEATTERIGAAFIHDKSIASGYVETNREPKGSTIEVKALNKTAITCTAVETLSGYTKERSRPPT